MASSAAGDLGRELVRLDKKRTALTAQVEDVTSTIARLQAEKEQMAASIADIEARSKVLVQDYIGRRLLTPCKAAIRRHAEGHAGGPRMMTTPSTIAPTMELDAKTASTSKNPEPSLHVTLKVPQKPREILSAVGYAMLNRSPKDAAGVPMRSGPNIIHKNFPTVVLLSGLWYDISCNTCGSNATPIMQTFFRGISGLRLHMAKAHYESGVTIPKDAIAECTRRLVTPGDVTLMLQGLEPEDSAIAKIQPQDEPSSGPPEIPTRLASLPEPEVHNEPSHEGLPPRLSPLRRSEIPESSTTSAAPAADGDEGTEPLAKPGEEKQIIHPDWPNVLYLDGHWTEVKCSECGANRSIHSRHFMSIIGLRRHFIRVHGYAPLGTEHYSTRIISLLDAYLMQHGSHPLDQAIEMVPGPLQPSKPVREQSVPHESSSPENEQVSLTQYEVFQNLAAEARASGTPRVKTRNKKRKNWATLGREDYESK